jgi:tRNA(Ile2) C34 agmatinyltransferase TiaS
MNTVVITKGEKMSITRCPYCGGKVKAKGIYDICGTVSWKCRSCGRRTKERHIGSPKLGSIIKISAPTIGG